MFAETLVYRFKSRKNAEINKSVIIDVNGQSVIILCTSEFLFIYFNNNIYTCSINCKNQSIYVNKESTFYRFTVDGNFLSLENVGKFENNKFYFEYFIITKHEFGSAINQLSSVNDPDKLGCFACNTDNNIYLIDWDSNNLTENKFSVVSLKPSTTFIQNIFKSSNYWPFFDKHCIVTTCVSPCTTLIGLITMTVADLSLNITTIIVKKPEQKGTLYQIKSISNPNNSISASIKLSEFIPELFSDQSVPDTKSMLSDLSENIILKCEQLHNMLIIVLPLFVQKQNLLNDIDMDNYDTLSNIILLFKIRRVSLTTNVSEDNFMPYTLEHYQTLEYPNDIDCIDVSLIDDKSELKLCLLALASNGRNITLTIPIRNVEDIDTTQEYVWERTKDIFDLTFIPMPKKLFFLQNLDVNYQLEALINIILFPYQPYHHLSVLENFEIEFNTKVVWLESLNQMTHLDLKSIILSHCQMLMNKNAMNLEDEISDISNIFASLVKIYEACLKQNLTQQHISSFAEFVPNTSLQGITPETMNKNLVFIKSPAVKANSEKTSSNIIENTQHQIYRLTENTIISKVDNKLKLKLTNIDFDLSFKHFNDIINNDEHYANERMDENNLLLNDFDIFMIRNFGDVLYPNIKHLDPKKCNVTTNQMLPFVDGVQINELFYNYVYDIWTNLSLIKQNELIASLKLHLDPTYLKDFLQDCIMDKLMENILMELKNVPELNDYSTQDLYVQFCAILKLKLFPQLVTQQILTIIINESDHTPENESKYLDKSHSAIEFKKLLYNNIEKLCHSISRILSCIWLLGLSYPLSMHEYKKWSYMEYLNTLANENIFTQHHDYLYHMSDKSPLTLLSALNCFSQVTTRVDHNDDKNILESLVTGKWNQPTFSHILKFLLVTQQYGLIFELCDIIETQFSHISNNYKNIDNNQETLPNNDIFLYCTVWKFICYLHSLYHLDSNAKSNEMKKLKTKKFIPSHYDKIEDSLQFISNRLHLNDSLYAYEWLATDFPNIFGVPVFLETAKSVKANKNIANTDAHTSDMQIVCTIILYVKILEILEQLNLKQYVIRLLHKLITMVDSHISLNHGSEANNMKHFGDNHNINTENYIDKNSYQLLSDYKCKLQSMLFKQQMDIDDIDVAWNTILQHPDQKSRSDCIRIYLSKLSQTKLLGKIGALKILKPDSHGDIINNNNAQNIYDKTLEIMREIVLYSEETCLYNFYGETFTNVFDSDFTNFSQRLERMENGYNILFGFTRTNLDYESAIAIKLEFVRKLQEILTKFVNLYMTQLSMSHHELKNTLLHQLLDISPIDVIVHLCQTITRNLLVILTCANMADVPITLVTIKEKTNLGKLPQKILPIHEAALHRVKDPLYDSLYCDPLDFTVLANAHLNELEQSTNMHIETVNDDMGDNSLNSHNQSLKSHPEQNALKNENLHASHNDINESNITLDTVVDSSFDENSYYKLPTIKSIPVLNCRFLYTLLDTCLEYYLANITSSPLNNSSEQNSEKLYTILITFSTMDLSVTRNFWSYHNNMGRNTNQFELYSEAESFESIYLAYYDILCQSAWFDMALTLMQCFVTFNDDAKSENSNNNTDISFSNHLCNNRVIERMIYSFFHNLTKLACTIDIYQIDSFNKLKKLLNGCNLDWYRKNALYINTITCAQKLSTYQCISDRGWNIVQMQLQSFNQQCNNTTDSKIYMNQLYKLSRKTVCETICGLEAPLPFFLINLYKVDPNSMAELLKILCFYERFTEALETINYIMDHALEQMTNTLDYTQNEKTTFNIPWIPEQFIYVLMERLSVIYEPSHHKKYEHAAQEKIDLYYGMMEKIRKLGTSLQKIK